MPISHRVYAGIVGQSVWRSDDQGETFQRASKGMFPESDVRALAFHPAVPRILFAGTDSGVYRSDDGADSWEHLPSPMDARQIWSLAFHPSQPEVLFAGTCPADLFRSLDGGRTWKLLEAGMPRKCLVDAPIIPRVTCIHFDPNVRERILAGVEIAGFYRSDDGGEHWRYLSHGLGSLDIHDFAVLPHSPGTLVATTNRGLFLSADAGLHWTSLNVEHHLPWSYARPCILDAGDMTTLYIGIGNGPPGSRGALFRTRDLGQSWQRCALPNEPNSTIWNLAACPADPSLLYVSTINGEVYRSVDRGDSWTKTGHEFGEVRALAWIPFGPKTP
ncbi:MAG: hypothetical protein HYU36_12315 [Planctomycetes bacterium]|nr:hypothetical protein [Planctomycetota bacterium]